MPKKKNFYAVRVGRKPGIYATWFGNNGAEAQVKNYPKAVFKGFFSREQAEEFLKGSGESHATKKSKREEGNNSQTDENPITIYTDGGCINNPGPGGYGVVILNQVSRHELSGGYRLTTDNRMELMACIVGLRSLESPSSVLIHSDSKYVVDGISKGWAKSWQMNNWKRSNGRLAENIDLWKQLLELCDKNEIKFIWVKGHAGDTENERCDELANKAALKINLLIDEFYEGIFS